MSERNPAVMAAMKVDKTGGVARQAVDRLPFDTARGEAGGADARKTRLLKPDSNFSLISAWQGEELDGHADIDCNGDQ